jgi:hypothetical protein
VVSREKEGICRDLNGKQSLYGRSRHKRVWQPFRNVLVCAPVVFIELLPSVTIIVFRTASISIPTILFHRHNFSKMQHVQQSAFLTDHSNGGGRYVSKEEWYNIKEAEQNASRQDNIYQTASSKLHTGSGWPLPANTYKLPLRVDLSSMLITYHCQWCQHLLRWALLHLRQKLLTRMMPTWDDKRRRRHRTGMVSTREYRAEPCVR